VIEYLTTRLNTFRSWILIAAIGAIMLVNVAVTSNLTRQSLADTPLDSIALSLDPVAERDIAIADLDPAYFETADTIVDPAIAATLSRSDDTATVSRTRPQRPRKTYTAASTRLSERRFQPRVIRYSAPATAKAPELKTRAYPVRPLDYAPAASAHIKPHKKDPFVLRMIKKPYDWLKVVASKLH